MQHLAGVVVQHPDAGPVPMVGYGRRGGPASPQPNTYFTTPLNVPRLWRPYESPRASTCSLNLARNRVFSDQSKSLPIFPLVIANSRPSYSGGMNPLLRSTCVPLPASTVANTSATASSNADSAAASSSAGSEASVVAGSGPVGGRRIVSNSRTSASHHSTVVSDSCKRKRD